MKKLFVANWKSNKNREEVEKWMDKFSEFMARQQAADSFNSTVVICPPMPFVELVSKKMKDESVFKNVFLGVQDMSQFPAGSYTGAVSARNLEGFNVQYAIIGHSERRKYFHETHQEIANKIDQCLENSIQPIMCIDADQMHEQFSHLADDVKKKTTVAYEPIKYIGGTETQPADEAVRVIREIIDRYSPKQVIYGGSVNPDSIAPFLHHDEVAGFLIGGASLKAESFGEIIIN